MIPLVDMEIGVYGDGLMLVDLEQHQIKGQLTEISVISIRGVLYRRVIYREHPTDEYGRMFDLLPSAFGRYAFLTRTEHLELVAYRIVAEAEYLKTLCDLTTKEPVNHIRALTFEGQL